jgi:hypothetical protein
VNDSLVSQKFSRAQLEAQKMQVDALRIMRTSPGRGSTTGTRATSRCSMRRAVCSRPSFPTPGPRPCSSWTS